MNEIRSEGLERWVITWAHIDAPRQHFKCHTVNYHCNALGLNVRAKATVEDRQVVNSRFVILSPCCQVTMAEDGKYIICTFCGHQLATTIVAAGFTHELPSDESQLTLEGLEALILIHGQNVEPLTLALHAAELRQEFLAIVEDMELQLQNVLAWAAGR